MPPISFWFITYIEFLLFLSALIVTPIAYLTGWLGALLSFILVLNLPVPLFRFFGLIIPNKYHYTFISNLISLCVLQFFLFLVSISFTNAFVITEVLKIIETPGVLPQLVLGFCLIPAIAFVAFVYLTFSKEMVKALLLFDRKKIQSNNLSVFIIFGILICSTAAIIAPIEIQPLSREAIMGLCLFFTLATTFYKMGIGIKVLSALGYHPIASLGVSFLTVLFGLGLGMGLFIN